MSRQDNVNIAIVDLRLQRMPTISVVRVIEAMKEIKRCVLEAKAFTPASLHPNAN